MSRQSIIFIGELPPPYGGVAVKNKLVYEHIFKGQNTKFIDLVICKRQPWRIPEIFLKLIFGMLNSKSVIIGVGTTWRRIVLMRLQRVLTGKKGMRKIVLLVMGGQFHHQVEENQSLRKFLRQINSVWVETYEMQNSLKCVGVNRTFYFPNARSTNGAIAPNMTRESTALKLVFFSRICLEKGVDIIMDAYEKWAAVSAPITLDFYGEISDNIKENFTKFVESNNNICYHGVFDAVNQNVYAELNQYDVMLLPTRWEGEGVPGALIESKMAGISAIVSDWHANSEVVRNEEEGIVLSSTTADNLATAVIELCGNPKRVRVLKEGAYASRTRYCIETYRDALIKITVG